MPYCVLCRCLVLRPRAHAAGKPTDGQLLFLAEADAMVTAAMQRFFFLRPIRFVLEGLPVHGHVGVRYQGTVYSRL